MQKASLLTRLRFSYTVALLHTLARSLRPRPAREAGFAKVHAAKVHAA